ncbi:MAG: putative inorganic carbon transporter subunit DabA [Planctomycetaceae bacterium]
MSDLECDVEQEIRQLAELLPLQGPITSFAFLNPLQGMEQSSFFDVLRQVPEIYGCEPWLSETRYRNKLQRGRIRESDLREILEEDCGPTAQRPVAGLTPRIELRLTRLRDLLTPETDHELHWMIAELDGLRSFHAAVPASHRKALLESARAWLLNWSAMTPADREASPHQSMIAAAGIQPAAGYPDHWTETNWEAASLQWMWALIRRGLGSISVSVVQQPVAGAVRIRELLFSKTGQDPDELVNEVLVGFCAAWLDQGYAQWSLPDQEDGFLAAFCGLFRSSVFGARRWLRDLPAALEPLRSGQTTPAASILASLQAFGISSSERRTWLRQSLLALRGWAGMLWQTETRPDRVFRASPPGTLMQFLAVRLILDQFATAEVIRRNLGSQLSIPEATARLRSEFRHAQQQSTLRHEAFVLLQLAQIHGWGPGELASLTSEQ